MRVALSIAHGLDAPFAQEQAGASYWRDRPGRLQAGSVSLILGSSPHVRGELELSAGRRAQCAENAWVAAPPLATDTPSPCPEPARRSSSVFELAFRGTAGARGGYVAVGVGPRSYRGQVGERDPTTRASLTTVAVHLALGYEPRVGVHGIRLELRGTHLGEDPLFLFERRHELQARVGFVFRGGR